MPLKDSKCVRGVKVLPTPRFEACFHRIRPSLDTQPRAGFVPMSFQSPMGYRNFLIEPIGRITYCRFLDRGLLCCRIWKVFAGSVSVSHGFVHFVDFGGTVQVARLSVASGDL